MKKLISLLLAVCLVLGSALCGALAEENMDCKADHFSFTLPGQWLSVTPEDDPTTTYYYKEEVQSIRGGYLMASYENNSIGEDQMEYVQDYYEGIIEGFKQMSADQDAYTEDITVASCPAKFIRYNLDKNGTIYQVPSAVIMIKGNVLLLMYLNSSVDDAEAETIFRGIVDTVTYHD